MSTTTNTSTITRRTLAACALTVALAAAGCQNSGAGGAGRRDTGSATSAGKTIPSDARQIDQKTHARLTQRTQREGTIWIQDATANKVIYSGKVRADANVVVDPRADAVTVNDIQVKNAPHLNPDHTYKLFFKGR
jgi:hypothetical protein